MQLSKFCQSIPSRRQLLVILTVELESSEQRSQLPAHFIDHVFYFSISEECRLPIALLFDILDRLCFVILLV